MNKSISNNLLFLLSNFFYFLTILFTYINLKEFEISERVYPNDFNFLTYSVLILFFLSLLLLYFKESKNKFKVFNIFIYYLILSSGVYVLNFPFMDELILISSSIFFLTYFFFSYRSSFNYKALFSFIIFTILLIQSIYGFLYDIRSIRYLAIFICLLITLIYFSSLKEIDDDKQKSFFEYIFYAIILYVIYQIFFWFLKFQIFEMKFTGQKFIGNMQPSYALSASGHFDSIHILSGFMILYYSIKSGYFLRSLALWISILSFWVLADARSSLFIFCSVSLFYFVIIDFKKKIVLITLLFLVFVQSFYFDNSFNNYFYRIKNITLDIIDIRQGSELKTPDYKLPDGDYFYKEKLVASYQDFGRLSFAVGAINSLKYNFFKIFFGCGFYGYYDCTYEARKDIFSAYDVPYDDKSEGFLNKKLRPPAFGTIFIENGLFLILAGLIYYLYFLKNKFIEKRNLAIKNSKTIHLSIYLSLTIISWTIFSNIMDIIYIYLFMIPVFNKYLFYKT